MVEQPRILEKESKEKIRYVGFGSIELFLEFYETIKRLKQRGYRIFVSSSIPQAALDEFSERYDLKELLLGTNPQNPDFKKGKLHFELVAKYFGIPYETFVKQTVIISDDVSDMEVTVANGMIGLGRSKSLEAEDTDKLQAAGARFVFKDLWPLPEILPSL